MKTRFNFNKDNLTRYFIDNYCCWYCGKNQWDSFHHIHPKSDSARCSNSLFNVAPIHNYPCHLNNHGKLTTNEWRKKLLQKTAKYIFSLVARGEYTLTDDDRNFLFENKKYYK